MRDPRVIAAGQYAEAMPDGRWICTTNPYDPIQTSWGNLAPPTLGIITPRLDPTPGSRRLCGHEQDGDQVVELDVLAHPPRGPADDAGNGWRRLAKTHSGGMSSAFGPSGRIYWLPDWNSIRSERGVLVEGPDVAAGGLIHVGADPHGGDVPQVQAPQYADPVRWIWEYTTLGDVTVGQGNVIGGVLVLHGGKRYLLDDGHCWFVRFNRVGDELAVAYWKLHDKRAVLRWLSIADLVAFPQEPPRQSDTPRPPSPPPDDDKEPTVQPESLEDALHDARKRYGAKMKSEQCVEMLNRLLWEADDKGWRLFAKSPGQAGGNRHDGVRVSHDFLIHTSGWACDALGNAGGGGDGGPSTVQWDIRRQIHEHDEDSEDRWIKPIAPAGEPGQPHVPNPPGGPGPGTPPPQPDSAVLQRLDSLFQQLQEVTSAVRELKTTQEQNVGQLHRDVEQLGTTLEDEVTKLREQVSKTAGGEMHGEVSIPLVGTSRVDLRPGPRPKR